jgi:hypothetical protein
VVSERDMSDEQISDLRLAAILSWYYWCPEARAAHEKTKAERESRIERFRAELAKIFGSKCEMQISINGGCIEAVIEDLRLAAYEFTSPVTKEPRMMVSLLGRCSNCGAETLSEPVSDLAGLGERLEKFEPIYEHYCTARPRVDRIKFEKKRRRITIDF